MKNYKDFFSIEIQNHTMKMKLKGFWSDSQAEEVGDMFLSSFIEAVNTFDGRPFLIFADLTEFGSVTDKVKRSIGECMQYATEKGAQKAVEVISKTVLKMGVNKAAKENIATGDYRIVTGTLEEGAQIIAELEKELVALA